MYEVWHYKERSSDLFKDYISKFLKIKQECSGFPINVKSKNQKKRYIRKYLDQMEIELNEENIEYNPGMRAVAKLCLNSLWGSLGKNSINHRIVDLM